MSPARTADAARPGRRRFARGLRFGWSRRFGRRLGLKRPDRRGATSLGALAAYLIVVVTAPAWHHHDHAGHDHAGHDHAGHDHHGHAHHGHAAAPPTGCCGHGHAGHEHHGHAHQEAEAPETCGERADEPPHGHHACPICELLATPATPVTAPAVCDLGAALPTLQAPTAPDRRAVFLRTKHARGPPRV